MLLLRLARLAALSAPLFAALPAVAGTYYVAQWGNVNALGTRSHPWDMARANRNAQPGDTIYVRRGIYNVGIRPMQSGTAAKPIVFALEPDVPVGSVARFEGTTPGQRFVCFNLSERSHVHIKGLQCDGRAVGALSTVENALSLRKASHNRIENCALLRTWSDMVLMTDGGGYNVIRNSSLRSAGANGGDSGEVVQIANSHHNLVEGNQIEYGGHTGIHIYDGSWNVVRNNTVRNPWTTAGTITGFLARYNLIEGNRILESATKEVLAVDGGISWKAWVISGSYSVFRRNLVYGNRYRGFEIVAKALTVRSQAEHIAIYNNVFHANGLAGLRFYADLDYATWTAGLRVVNNAFLDNNASGSAELEFELQWGGFDGAVVRNNNFLDDVPGRAVISVIGRLGTLPYHQSVNPQNFMLNREFDPLFVDAAAGDYRLRSTSPLRDRGAWLTRTRSAGSGNAIPVEEADYFVGELDYGIPEVKGDAIVLEGGSSLSVLSVDRTSRILYVKGSTSWTAGQRLTLVFKGTAPDIGAIEY